MYELTGRVKSVNVDGEVDGVLGADSVADLLDDAVGSCGSFNMLTSGFSF